MKYEPIELDKKKHKHMRYKVLFTDDNNKQEELGPFLSIHEARIYCKLHLNIMRMKGASGSLS